MPLMPCKWKGDMCQENGDIGPTTAREQPVNSGKEFEPKRSAALASTLISSQGCLKQSVSHTVLGFCPPEPWDNKGVSIVEG